MEYRKFTSKEEKWLKEFSAIMKKAPNTLFMFIGPSIMVYPKDENNERYMHMRSGSLSVDGDATSCAITTKMEFDGGDY